MLGPDKDLWRDGKHVDLMFLKELNKSTGFIDLGQCFVRFQKIFPLTKLFTSSSKSGDNTVEMSVAHSGCFQVCAKVHFFEYKADRLFSAMESLNTTKNAI